MKLIVGLGNPGLIYANSRHNIGSTVVKFLAGTLKITLKKDSSVFSFTGKAKCGQVDFVLACPRNFMNLNGVAVKALLKKFKVTTENLLVVCDDLDLEIGRIKIRPRGSSGGQRGLKSIIEHLGTQDFSRLRIGIGWPKDPLDAADYVLSGFLRKEKTTVQEIKETAASCCLSWVEKGMAKTMNMFNKKGRTQ